MPQPQHSTETLLLIVNFLCGKWLSDYPLLICETTRHQQRQALQAPFVNQKDGHTRWAPTTYKWSYNPYKRHYKSCSPGLFHPYKWSYLTLLKTGDGAHLVGISCPMAHHRPIIPPVHRLVATSFFVKNRAQRTQPVKSCTKETAGFGPKKGLVESGNPSFCISNV